MLPKQFVPYLIAFVLQGVWGKSIDSSSSPVAFILEETPSETPNPIQVSDEIVETESASSTPELPSRDGRQYGFGFGAGFGGGLGGQGGGGYGFGNYPSNNYQSGYGHYAPNHNNVHHQGYDHNDGFGHGPSQGYGHGHESGYKPGHNNGYGHDNGYDHGHDSGFGHGHDSGYGHGHDNGYGHGHDSGYGHGQDNGFGHGHGYGHGGYGFAKPGGGYGNHNNGFNPRIQNFGYGRGFLPDFYPLSPYYFSKTDLGSVFPIDSPINSQPALIDRNAEFPAILVGPPMPSGVLPIAPIQTVVVPAPALEKGKPEPALPISDDSMALDGNNVTSQDISSNGQDQDKTGSEKECICKNKSKVKPNSTD